MQNKWAGMVGGSVCSRWILMCIWCRRMVLHQYAHAQTNGGVRHVGCKGLSPLGLTT
jgi:hypothetical protein